ncbi:MAG: hypothetical protein AAGG48_18720 [Planctomycetota bacterium]
MSFVLHRANQTNIGCYHMHSYQQLRRQRGVTLMEVIFSIGVILTGLVGVAALIPVAANNAKATLELDRGVSESTSAAAKGVAQSFLDLDSLVIVDKPTAYSLPRSVGGYGYVPSNALRTINWKINGQTNANPPESASTGPFGLYGKLETPGYGHMDLGSGLTSAICIDPIGIPDPAIDGTMFSAPTATDSAYDHSRFPYYSERYEILQEPNLPPSGGAYNALTPQWPMSPRMYRATLKLPIYPTTALPAQRNQLMSSAAIRRVFSGSGGVSGFGTGEPDQPHSVFLSSTTIGGSQVDGGRDNSSKYTWFMTLAPPFSGGNIFRQSIVIVRDRVAPVPIRAGDPLALRRASYSVEDSEDNPDTERVTWVGDSIGFVGGAGGEVLLYGSQAMSDDVQPGEWVMMSRQPHEFNVAMNRWDATNSAVHRWYRVLRVSETEFVSGFAWPGGTHNVWRRWVTLAGPDWVFQDGAVDGGGNPTAIDDTFCTIVRGAVSVIESEVEIQ